MNIEEIEMIKKIIEYDSAFCICGKKAKGIKKHNHYLIICDKCKKKYKFDSKKLYQETIYTMFAVKNRKLGYIKMMSACNTCGESYYHNYKYQFCVKCRVVKHLYK